MAERLPLVMRADGILEQIPAGDTISATIAPGSGGGAAAVNTTNYRYVTGGGIPATGRFTMNSDTLSAVTTINLNVENFDGNDIGALLKFLVENGSNLYVQKANDSTVYGIFTVSGAPTDNTTYLTITVTYDSGAGAFANNEDGFFALVRPAGSGGGGANTILNGTVDPTTEGSDGDFYINTTSTTIFGPKATTWPAGVSLIGADGTNGTDGADGQGVPVGGTAGQVLKKIDATDYNTEWADEAGGGGAGGSRGGINNAKYWRIINISSDYHTTLSFTDFFLADIDGNPLVPTSGSHSLTGDFSNIYDNNNATGVHRYSHPGDDNIIYTFDTPVSPWSVYVHSPTYVTDGPRAPSDWTLQSSQDGTNWDTVYQMVDETVFAANEGRSYPIPLVYSVDGTLPTGGTLGQILIKQSGTDYDLAFEDAPDTVNRQYQETVHSITDLTSDEVIDIQGYDELTIYYSDYTPSTSAAVVATLSNDGGSTYESSYQHGGAHVGQTEFYASVASIELTYGSASGVAHIGRWKVENIQNTAPTSFFGFFSTNNYNTFKTAVASAAKHTHLKISNGGGAFTGTIYVVGIKHGYKGILKREETASFTLTNSDFDGNTYIECNHATVDIEVTIPASLTSMQPLVLERTGAANVTLIHSAVTLNSRDSLDAIANQHSSITVIPKGSDVYNAQGDLG